MSNIIVKPIEVIRLGHSLSDKPRPLKVLFNFMAETLDVIKNKKGLSNVNTISSIIIRTDRTDYQRETMRKLCEELYPRKSNGKSGITIQFLKGVSSIAKEITQQNQNY